MAAPWCSIPISLDSKKTMSVVVYHGKRDHVHIDGAEMPYSFKSAEQLWEDFMTEVKRMGGLK